MSQPIIQIKGIGKRYDITHQRGGYVALRDVIANVLKRPFSFLTSKVKEVTGLTKREEFWALRDVSFDVAQGEVIGIIGKNGAGKSTLLKILTGITPPSEGEIIMHGRVASLLEVGTGFHPELTGRENIFLNGAILGMTRKEIARKFDEIVAFAGVEKFLDTPVKHYSSGMYVRLAFSVAAHMEPDILIIDEVLAVGDAEFQKKCLGKMEEVTRTQGRTILFVSHNMAAIRSLCKRTILLENGSLKKIGTTQEIIDEYLLSGSHSAEIEPRILTSAKMQITKIRLLNDKHHLSNQIDFGKTFSIEIQLLVNSIPPNPQISISCTDIEHNPIFFTSDSTAQQKIASIKSPGTYTIVFTFPSSNSIILNEGNYYLYVQPETNGVDGYGPRVQLHLSIAKHHNLEVPRDWSKEKRNGPMAVLGNWEIKQTS
jgi:lipopolysaccharide transport system ATP-binding protein